MSDSSSLVTAEHFRYIAERTAPEDALLIELKKAAIAEGIPPIWIAPEQASFMQILLRAAHVKEVVEIGTLAGYSAITMARALPADGHVRTIEISPKHADFARRWIAKSDVAGTHRGDDAARRSTPCRRSRPTRPTRRFSTPTSPPIPSTSRSVCASCAAAD